MILNKVFTKPKLIIFLKRLIFREIKDFQIILKLECHFKKSIRLTNLGRLIIIVNIIKIYHLFILMDSLNKNFRDSFLPGEPILLFFTFIYFYLEICITFYILLFQNMYHILYTPISHLYILYCFVMAFIYLITIL